MADRGFSTESSSLHTFCVEMDKCLHQAETFIFNQKNVNDCKEKLKEFKENYKTLFNEAKKNLQHHRGNIVYLDVFLSCITFGIYALALLTNYAINGKSSFFTTETISKLETADSTFNEYIDCLYEVPSSFRV